MATQISQRAFDLCVRHEVTSKAYYIRHYQKPEWPGLSSGVTVAIGYDLGQASPAKIRADWKGLVPDDMLEVMVSCSGATGNAGKAKLAQVKNKITIGWDAALHVFANRDVPQWTAGVLQRVPGSAKLTPSELGVLFDTAYNRGHSWSSAGDRYSEMRTIKQLVGVGTPGALARVPDQYKSMKRLWPNTAGLLRRCDDRAALWAWALTNGADDLPINAATPATPDPEVPTNAGPARTKPPVTTPTQNTTTAIIVAGGASVAKQAADQGHGAATAVGIAVGAALLAGVVWYIWHRNRNPK